MSDPTPTSTLAPPLPLSAPAMSAGPGHPPSSPSTLPLSSNQPTTASTASPPVPAPTTTISHPLDPSASATASPAPASEAEIVADPLQPSHTGSSTPPVPKVHLRALIISGQSHVYSFEPELTVGRVKELIWNSWPSEWTDPAQPPSPSYLRILHAGRILQDDSTLTSTNIPATLAPSSPTVVHISVRSFSIRNDDDPKKPALLGRTTSAARSHHDEVGGCRCIIM